MRINWRLRLTAAQKGIWTGTELRRLMADRAGVDMSSASVSALFTKQPNQIKLSTLVAFCTALECTPNDLIDVDTTPVEAKACKPLAAKQSPKAAAAGHGRSMPPL
jgi:DNA-binding Xre family transcriptional regulator